MIPSEIVIISVTSIITVVVSHILGPIIVEYVRERKKKNKDTIKESLKTNISVTNKLDEIREKYEADRAWVYQFHNGGHFYPTGKSIQKFSMGYEVVNPGVPSIQANFQNIPISLFSKSMNQLLEHNIIQIPDFKDENIATYGLKYSASEMGCKSTYMISLRSIDNRFIGVVGLDYTKRKKLLSEEDIHNLRNDVAIVGGNITNLLDSK